LIIAVTALGDLALHRLGKAVCASAAEAKTIKSRTKAAWAAHFIQFRASIDPNFPRIG
jgi:hypothetical protein